MNADLEARVAKRDGQAVLGGEPSRLHHIADNAVHIEDVDGTCLDELSLAVQVQGTRPS